MIFRLLLLAVMLLPATAALASDTLYVREKQVPVLIEREDNVLFELKLSSDGWSSLSEIVLDFGQQTALRHIRAVKLYYAGTETRTSRREAFHPVEYISSMEPGHTLKANPSYSVLKARVRWPGCATWSRPG